MDKPALGGKAQKAAGERKERIFPFQSRFRDAPEHRLARGYYRVESKRYQGRARVGQIPGARGDSVKILVAPPGC